jgi:NitT/TauT family transport system permease protein
MMAVEPTARTPRSKRPRPPRREGGIPELVSRVGLPALSFLLLLAAWQALVVGLRVPEYIVPAPSVFLARVWTARHLLWVHLLVTSREAVLGFAIAAVVSVPLALLITSVPLLERAVYPVIVFFQLIPKIAVAPLFIVWFGIGQPPKVFLTFLLCFFPILVDSMTGFKALDRRLLYLTQSMGATPWQTFRYVRLPAALPFVFSGFKVAIVFAATGAIVGEFVGANAGLGYLLLRGSSYLDTGLIFAVLVALSVMGLVLSYGVSGLEQAFMPWKRREE